MKLLGIFMLFTLSFSSFADIVSFQCKSTPVPGVNQFTAKGIVAWDEHSNVNGVIDIQVQKIDEEGSAQIFEQVAVTGVVKHYARGEMTRSSFDQLILTTNHPYLKSMNLLLDEYSALSSQVLSIDNFLYRSNCETVR